MEQNLKTKNLHFQRFEFKYKLPADLAHIIIPKLLKYMDWDPYVADKPDKKYQVASLYYDSAGLACYHEKIAGVKKRKKLRLRIYDSKLRPESDIFIEIKRKDDAIVLKDRVVVKHSDCQRLLYDGELTDFLAKRLPNEREFLDEFLWTKEHNCLTPKIMVIYNRMPLVGKIDKKLRVTLDSEIRAYPADWLNLDDDAAAVELDYVIMELKYNNVLPAWMHHVIQDYNLERIAYSKYCMGIEACQRNNLITI